MTEIQKYLLKLLEEIDRICIENNIEYYVFAGTMLGIERNEGFLPWDDDIDIIMTKANYDRFSEFMKTNPPPSRAFECIERNKEYPLQFGRYTSLDTSGITRSLAFGNSSAGVWVDIIFVAPLPTSVRKIKRIKKWFSCYCELENEVYVEHKNHYKGFYWRYRLGVFFISIFGKQKVIKHLKKWFDGFSERECDMYFMYHSLFTDFRAFDKRFFQKPVRKNFNGIDVNVSPYNREFSRVLYGDSWMIVPEASEQEVHTIVLDLDISYEKYVNDYMIFLDKKEVAETISNMKKLQLKNFELFRTSITDKIYLKGILINEELKKEIRQLDISLKKMLSQEDFMTISKLYEDYVICQFNHDVLFWDVFIPLDDDLLYPILMKLICYDGQYYKAQKVLQLRNRTRKDPESEDLEKLQSLILLCKRLSIALWDQEDITSVKAILKEKVVDEIDFFCIDIELCRCYVLMHEVKEYNDCYALRSRLQMLLEKIPEQGEIIKLLGDIELKLGNKDIAIDYYDRAAELTHNGLVLLDIQKKKEAYNNEKQDNFIIKGN